MIEKYDYRSWIKAQRDGSGDCVEVYNDSSVDGYSGEDTYGYCLRYCERSKELTPTGKPKRIYYKFTILVSQDGAKLILIGKTPFPFEAVNKAAETLYSIRESLNNFKFYPKEAMFWLDKPLTPDYISPLWYHHNDKEKIKVEDVDNYIKSLKGTTNENTR